jgi:hypothetical protein
VRNGHILVYHAVHLGRRMDPRRAMDIQEAFHEFDKGSWLGIAHDELQLFL